MSRQEISDDDIVRMLDVCHVSDPEDVLIESEEECIPQGDASEEEDNLEADIAIENSDGDSDEDEFIAKSARKWTRSLPPVTRHRQCNIVYQANTCK